MQFKPTSRYGLKNNMYEIERRLTQRCVNTMYLIQIRCGGQVYNLLVPKYLMTALGTRGICTLVEERKTTVRDYTQAQMRGKPLPPAHMEVRSNRQYEIIANPNRHCNYPVLMIDNS